MSQQKFKVYRRKRSDRDPYYPREHWLMTADELLQRVRADSERSNYNWITSATELVHTCQQPDFPDDVAAEIKDRILVCFANLGNAGDLKGDKIAVFYCYTSSKNDAVRTRFLKGMVRGAIERYFMDEVTRMFYHDAEFERKFVDKKVEEFQTTDSELASQSFEVRRGGFAKWINALSDEYSEALDRALQEGEVKPNDLFLPTFDFF